MPNPALRSIAVIDVGATNAKTVQFGPDLAVLAERSMAVRHLETLPYRQLDPEAVLDFARSSIREFDRTVPVDAIVPCTHGSALALLDMAGDLALPVMSYMAAMPDDIAGAYSEIEPPFTEVLAPTNPGALTLGRQLLWQEMRCPEAFASVRTILPYAQYIAFRLCGEAASEVSALGAQTHLWAPRQRGFSSLAKARGWAGRFAPIRGAGEVLGEAGNLCLKGRGEVLCGVHDSNANFLRYVSERPLVLLSTGTWVIAFDSAAPLDRLDGTRDQVSNTTVSGDPVACARFMGGEEYARVAGPSNGEAPDFARVAELIGQGVMALPSFTDMGGPVPGRGGKGRIAGTADLDAAGKASLAALYSAQMTALALERLGKTRKVVVDGPFGANRVFLGLLAALLPGRRVFVTSETRGTAAGAASLALGSDVPGPHLIRVEAPAPEGLGAYHARWLSRL